MESGFLWGENYTQIDIKKVKMLEASSWKGSELLAHGGFWCILGEIRRKYAIQLLLLIDQFLIIVMNKTVAD